MRFASHTRSLGQFTKGICSQFFECCRLTTAYLYLNSQVLKADVMAKTPSNSEFSIDSILKGTRSERLQSSNEALLLAEKMAGWLGNY